MINRQETLVMRWRRLLLVVVAVALLGVGGFFLFLWPTTPAPTPGVTLENFRRLREGMSAKQVEAILGKPQETYRVPDGYTWRCWRCESVEIQLVFYPDVVWGRGDLWGHGDFSWEMEHLHGDESPLDRIRQWLNSDALALRHAYITFAIAAGVLVLLLWLYRKRRKLSSSPK